MRYDAVDRTFYDAINHEKSTLSFKLTELPIGKAFQTGK